MTYRERREAKAARLQEWAEKRTAKAEASYQTATTLADAIPFGQPMLVDHHSYKSDVSRRNRIHSAMDKSLEHAAKAKDMASRADNITAALDASIFSDDPDATEALSARIAELEAERDRINAYNASCRKGAPDLSLLDGKQKADLLSIVRYASYQLRKGGQFPAYVTSNISGRISKDRARLESLTGEGR